MNPAFEKFFGFKKEEVLEKPTFETPIMTEETKKIISEKRELYGVEDVVMYEVPLMRRSGDVAQILITQTCIYNEEGEVTNWVVEFKDITELRRAQKYTQTLIKKIPIVMSLMDEMDPRCQ